MQSESLLIKDYCVRLIWGLPDVATHWLHAQPSTGDPKIRQVSLSHDALGRRFDRRVALSVTQAAYAHTLLLWSVCSVRLQRTDNFPSSRQCGLSLTTN